MEAIKKLLNKRVVIRADRAGVLFGKITEIEPLGDKYQVELKECRRLWYWSGAASITQLACEGVKNPSQCKFTMAQKSVVINGVIEVHPCTEEAIKSLDDVAVWKR